MFRAALASAMGHSGLLGRQRDPASSGELAVSIPAKESICKGGAGWCVSTDKEFAPKAADVVGLYLNPPLNAVVLSVDEKPSIQAIERASGYVETDSGKVVRGLKSTYKRHGTLNLFAALEVGTGQVKTKFTEFKKREDFRGFLDGVLADQAQDAEIHVILDNYSPHKRNDDWLAKFEGRVQFHFTPTSASWRARHSMAGASKPKISCVRQLKPSSADTTNARNHSAGGSAKSRVANSRIPLLIYAIKH